jgi:hypothetical protein
MRLLRAVEGSVVWLIRDNPAAEANLRKEAAARSIDPQRLVFAQTASLEEHLARHRLADLFLDTLPYNAHTTASDALWTGLPIVTCLGESFSGRVAASLLHAIGLSELVTTNPEDYEALALRLANDPAALKGIRERLKTNRLKLPLFDTDRFRRHIESAYTTMWEIHQRGEPPRSFCVEPIAEPTTPARPRERLKPKPASARNRPAADLQTRRQSREQRKPQPLTSVADDKAVKLLFVCGPWGSGTTAVAGLLQRLGAAGVEPYFHTNDERTVNSYESMAFRDVIVNLADQQTVSLRNGADLIADSVLRKFRDQIMAGDLAAVVRARRPIFLKYPLSALLLPQICKLFDTRLVYVVRPIAEIETTRRRRDWNVELGAQGAEIIYSHMFRTFVENAFPTTIIRYQELLAAPEQHARTLSQFAGLSNSEEAIRYAASFIEGRAAGPSNHSKVDIAAQ